MTTPGSKSPAETTSPLHNQRRTPRRASGGGLGQSHINIEPLTCSGHCADRDGPLGADHDHLDVREKRRRIEDLLTHTHTIYGLVIIAADVDQMLPGAPEAPKLCDFSSLFSTCKYSRAEQVFKYTSCIETDSSLMALRI